MNEHNLSDEELDRWVEIAADSDPERRASAFRAEFERLQSEGFTHIHRHYYSEWDGFAERKAAVEAAGLPVLQTKRTFSWNEPRPPIDVPARLSFRSLVTEGKDALLAAAAAGLEGTLDRVEQAEMSALEDASLGELLREEWEEITQGFSYEPEWFQLAYNEQGELVGYVQPVTYPNCNKGDLQEASIYHIAVLPAHRGHGYVDDILAQAVSTLQKVGVWRIYCDTDSENFPMVAAFERAAFEEEGIMHMWRGEIAALLA